MRENFTVNFPQKHITYYYVASSFSFSFSFNDDEKEKFYIYIPPNNLQKKKVNFFFQYHLFVNTIS